MKKPFQVGERCNVKGFLFWKDCDAWTVQTVGVRGTVRVALGSGEIEVELDCGSPVRAWGPSCRRLVKKKRREWSLAVCRNGVVLEVKEGHVPVTQMLPPTTSSNIPVWVHVREVRRET